MERLLTLYSEVQSTDVRWLWYPFIAIGKITLLQGDPGDGKSTMMMNLIAELSTGGETPDSCKIGTPQKVIYQCSEDGVSDTIKPRLERCGADCKKIAFINEEVYNGLTLDDERIRQAIIEFRAALGRDRPNSGLSWQVIQICRSQAGHGNLCAALECGLLATTALLF